ncbi:alpha/beta fold hydrolase [Cyanobacterium stanieri LEGE 03274]|uniref:Alpha/beta fold hydrolase n=1 Tax=Cyanobacterium stanieri LEGE 03274 TaxID=1828756 RepID=A0ABR9V2V5_9CHRO|nr:alpha/beta fold hydrolase [Cyanobacterium stanieri]MBE9222203.1 alpha/beta fold hydrolase [Cyanobacterium stanieri LEGE 03274]
MNPILLIHGFMDRSIVFDQMLSYLVNEGHNVHTIDLTPRYGTADLKVLAQQVKKYIDDTFNKEEKINLLGFSMGGLVTRYYLQRLGGVEKVNKYISISAPNNGTFTAYFLPFVGIKQMRPRSDFLLDLNKDIISELDKVKCLFLWTPFDLMIFPAQSSIMASFNAETIPVLTHKWMVSDDRVLERINLFLKDE